MAATLGHDVGLHRHQRCKLANDAVPPHPLPYAARVRAQGIRPHAHRQLHLQHFHRRVPGVGHPHVYGRRPVGSAARSLAAADRLVVGPRLPVSPSPERDVVHGPLSLRRDGPSATGEGELDGVGNALRRLHVPRRDGAGVARVDETSGRRGDPHGALDAGVRGNVGRQQRAHDEQDGGAGHREGAVDVPPSGGGGAREIGVEHAVSYIDAHRDRQVRRVDPIALEPVGRHECDRGQAGQGRARPARRVADQVARRRRHGRPAVAGSEGAQALSSPGRRGALRGEVTAPHLGRAHAREERPLHLGGEARRRNDHTLLLERARPRRHAPRLGAADVRMMGAHGAIRADGASLLHRHRLDEGHIG